ncbi:hypothetical protein [Streptococcus phage vB_SbRt-pBovineB21]|nr:hypothetical protein [Streptococcus phage vB_SbRt-pBovineB21]
MNEIKLKLLVNLLLLFLWSIYFIFKGKTK